MGSDPNLAALIEAAEQGSKPAADALLSALHSELRRLANPELARHGAPMSLCATTLRHKAYIEIAALRDVSERTVQRQWEKARCYLHLRIRADLEN